MRELAVRDLTSSQRRFRPSSGTIAFGLAALLAAVFSLAAALVALGGHAAKAPPAPSVANEIAARNARIAFFEQRAASDTLDFASLNTLAWEYLQRARELGDVGDYTRAEQAATRSLAILPKENYSGWTALGSLKLVQHDYAAALDLSLKAIDNRPGLSTGYGIEADALVGLGRYDEASSVLQKLVELDPTLPSLSRLANLAYLQGDILNSTDFWNQAVTRADGLPTENLAWAHAQLGTIALSQGDIARAESELQTSLRIYPDYVQGQAGLAAVRAAQGRYDESIALYETAQARLPQLPNIVALADVYQRAGLDQKAKDQRDLVEAVDRLYQANGINTDLQLALFYADHDMNLEEALNLAQSSYDSAPNVYAADALAWALYKSGRLDDAQRYAAEAMRWHTPEGGLAYHAGVIANALGDTATARTDLELALKTNPHFSVLHADDARKLLDALKGAR